MVIRVNVAEVVDNLIKDHDVILNSLKVLYKIINANRPNPDDVKLLIEFFDAFIDKCHHARRSSYYTVRPGAVFFWPPSGFITVSLGTLTAVRPRLSETQGNQEPIAKAL